VLANFHFHFNISRMLLYTPTTQHLKGIFKDWYLVGSFSFGWFPGVGRELGIFLH